MSLNRNIARNRISLASGAAERFSPAGPVGAILLHLAIIAGALFTWQHPLDIAQDNVPVVPVDLVTLAQKTNVMATVRPQPKPAPIAPTPVVQPEKSVAPPTPQEAETPPPDQAPSEPAIKAPPPPVIPKEKPKQAKAEAKKNTFDVDNVLALLNHVAPSPTRQNGRVSTEAHRGAGAETAMTADLAALLFSKIKRCWHPTVGAPNAAEIIVQYEVFLNPDGSVAREPQLDASSEAAANRATEQFGQSSTDGYVIAPNLSRSDAFKAAAAIAAKQAIYDCAPYKLPADQYAQWRDFVFTFDPTQMMGQ
jgi:outer membrane biosynthesis protein TonB